MKYKYQRFDLEKEQKFQRFRDCFISDYLVNLDSPMDLVIIGSDMVWALSEGFNSYMYGYGINTNNLVSYAACAGPSPIKYAKRLKIDDKIKKGLNRFQHIGVRDNITYQYVKEYCPQKEIKYTLDPVLLYGFEKEIEEWDTGHWKRHAPYLLIYAYNSNFENKREIKTIINFAKTENYSIVSCGYYHPWCDENVNADPIEFLEMFKHASFVITDTFHGTVFSLITKKNFIAVERDNGYKVRDLLVKCGLGDRIINTTDRLDSVKHPVDYTLFIDWLNEEREKSKEYLISILRERY